jgi:hypothetical protein
MAETMTDDELRAKAEKRVKQRMALMYSIGLWLVFSVFFFVLWLLIDGVGFHTASGAVKYPWFLWIVAAWGFAVLLQIVGYFSGRHSDSTRDRMVEKEMEKMKKEG